MFVDKIINNFSYPLWNENLAFGIPFNLNPNQVNNPLVLLFGIKNINLGLSFFYQLNLFIGSVYFFRLANFYGIKKNISLICTFTFLASSGSADWVYIKFLPSAVFAWCILPVLIFYYLTFLNINNKAKQSNKNGIIFSFLFGLLVLNSHPPIAILYAILFILISFLYFNQFLKKIRIVIMIILTIFLISLSKINILWQEYLLFDEDLPRNIGRITKNENWIKYSFVHTLFFKPFPIPLEFIKTISFNNIADGISILIEDLKIGFNRKFLGTRIDERDFFIGPIFSIIFIFSFFRKKNYFDKKLFFLIIILFLLFFFCPNIILVLIQRDFLFRDLIIIFIILFVGIYFKNFNKNLQKKLIIIHLISLILVHVSHFIHQKNVYKNNNFLFTKTINNDDYFIQTFKKFNLDKHQRIYLTEKAGDVFPSKSFNYYYNFLSFLGYKVINSNTKGVSLDNFYPAYRKFEGIIKGDEIIQKNQTSQFFLRIKYIIALKNEDYSKNLKYVGSVKNANGQELIILENTNFKEFGYTINASALDKANTYLENCIHQRLLCIDFEKYKKQLVNRNISVKRISSEKMSISLETIDGNEIIIIPEAFRKDWNIENKNFKIFNIFNGFIGIQRKDNSEAKLNEKIDIVYYPKVLIYLKLLTFSIFMFYLYLIFNYKFKCRNQQ